MPLLSIENLGKLGMIADVRPQDLPPEAWTNVRNVRFRDNQVRKMEGDTAVYPELPIVPYWLLNVSGGTHYWMLAGEHKVYITDGTAYTNITRQTASVDVDYSMEFDTRWNGGLLGGVPVLNNGVDVPQFWNPQSPATKLQDLTAWPSTYRARVVRPFKQFLFALNITKDTTNYPHMVKWSHSADPGTVPASWDHTDPTLDAGEVDLTDVAAGPLLDCLPLRDSLMIYKEGSVWGVLYVGGQFIFRFYKVFEQLGAMGAECMSLLGDGAQHIVMTGEDIIIHDGQQASSVLTGRMRRWLASAISNANYRRSFMVRHVYRRESWFCFPHEGSEWPNLALVYDWDTGTCTVRDIEQPAAFIAPGRIVAPDVQTWDSDPNVWISDPQVWDSMAHPPYQYRLLQTSPASSRLYFLENGQTFADLPIQAFAERTGLAILGRDRQGNWKADISKMKLVKGLRPKLEGQSITAQIGVQQYVDGPIEWAPAQVFTQQQFKLDFALTGRLIAVRFQCTQNSTWAINGYDLDIEVLGDF